MLGLSLVVFVSLYIILGVVDFILMRRFARLDPPEPGAESSDSTPVPVMSY